MADEWRAHAGGHDSEGRNDLVLATAKASKHLAGFARVVRLAEDVLVLSHNGVCGEYQRLRIAQSGSFGFRAGDACCDDLRIGAASRVLVDIDWANVEREAEAGKEFAAAWRGGGEDQSRVGLGPTCHG
jgi:hypothetical protein